MLPWLLLSGMLRLPAEALPDWPTFQHNPARTGAVQTPYIKNPTVIWRTKVGIQGWLNSPVLDRQYAYVGSSGSEWDMADCCDGVYALDIQTGKLKWYKHTEADVNGIGLAKGHLFITDDNGTIRAVSIVSGKTLWLRQFGRNIWSNADTFWEPYPLRTHPLMVMNQVIVGNSQGEWLSFHQQRGNLLWRRTLPGEARGGATASETAIFLTSTAGYVQAVDFKGRQLWQTQVRVPYPLASGRTDDFPVQIYAPPTLIHHKLIISFIRHDRDSTPALIALDPHSGKVLWRANTSQYPHIAWGNIRSSPAVYGNLLVYGEPYSNHVVGVDVDSGQVQWLTAAGKYMFQQWASPAIQGNQVILPRHDGGVYALNATNGNLQWQLFLGEKDKVGEDVPRNVMTGGGNRGLRTLNSDPIFASPAIAPNGMVVVSGGDGYVYGLGDKSWIDAKLQQAVPQTSDLEVYERQANLYAIEYNTELIKYMPKKVSFYVKRGQAYLNLRMWGQAQVDFLAAVNIRSERQKADRSDAYAWLARLYLYQQNWSASQSAIDESIRLTYQITEEQRLLQAHLLLFTNQLTAARKYYHKLTPKAWCGDKGTYREVIAQDFVNFRKWGLPTPNIDTIEGQLP